MDGGNLEHEVPWMYTGDSKKARMLSGARFSARTGVRMLWTEKRKRGFASAL